MLLIKLLVRVPEDVEIARSEDDLGVLFRIWINSSDMPRLIGKGGETIKAIRSVAKLIGYNHDVRASLKLEEPRSKKE